jgi:hypothetical protein
MLYICAHGLPVHRIPSGHRTDAAAYVLERKSVTACGCDGCRLYVWSMDVHWWHRMLSRVRTERQVSAYCGHAVRLLDRAESLIRSGKLLALESSTIDRGVNLVAMRIAQLERPAADAQAVN